MGFWFPGQYASLAAVPASPGLTVSFLPYLWAGSVSASRSFPRNGQVTAGLESQIGLLIAQVGYSPKPDILGGRLYAGLGWGVGTNTSKATLSLPIGSTALPLAKADSVTGVTDLYPLVDLAWNKGSNNGMVYLTGGLPVGAYSSQRLSNIGLNHYAIDLGAGYTYLNEKSGLEGSAVTGFTFNFENPATQYTNGVDWHLDWALSQFLSEAFHVGVVGYVYSQLSADSYPTSGVVGEARKEVLGGFYSGVAALGGETGAIIKVGKLQGYLNVRGYWEFWSQNRLRGYAIFTQLNIPVFK